MMRAMPGIVLARGDDDAINRGLAAAREAMPEEDGWRDYDVVIQEIPDQIDLGEWRLTWSACELSTTQNTRA